MTPALCAGAPSTDETDGKALDRVVVGTALNQLQPLDREAIVKAYYLGFTTRRIAEDQGVTESVVMSRLHAALSVLRLTVENGLGSR